MPPSSAGAPQESVTLLWVAEAVNDVGTPGKPEGVAETAGGILPTGAGGR